MKKIKEFDIFKTFFNVDEEVELTTAEEEVLIELKEQVEEIIQEEGEVGDVQIKEAILDELLKNQELNIIKYLGLEIEEAIKENISTQLEDSSFLKVENSDTDGDFFNNYLKDDIVNDLIMSLKGYERKAEGSKEIFIKKRKSLIPTTRIDAINRILISKFNKTDFLSDKDDNEQAMIIMFVLEQVFEQLLEIPYDLCDTQITMEIMTMCAVKLSNSIGLSKGFRKELMDTLKESMQSRRNQNTGNTSTSTME